MRAAGDTAAHGPHSAVLNAEFKLTGGTRASMSPACRVTTEVVYPSPIWLLLAYAQTTIAD